MIKKYSLKQNIKNDYYDFCTDNYLPTSQNWKQVKTIKRITAGTFSNQFEKWDLVKSVR